MLIQILVDEVHPPVGVVAGGDAPDRPFTGWLGLLGVLAELLDRSPGGGSSQLGPGGHPQLGQEMGDMVADRAPGQEHGLGDLGIGQALGDEPGNVGLGVSEGGPAAGRAAPPTAYTQA